jgi:hypothetical protein
VRAWGRYAVGLLALTLCGCRAHFQTRTAIPADLEVQAVIVYPFGFRWPEPAYRSFELSQRLIDLALDKYGEDALFFGPSEFKVYRAEDDNAWAASNAVSLFPEYRLSVHKGIVLRPWAERRQATSQKELYDATGKVKGITTVQETTYIGHVELLHPSTRTVVVEVTGEAAVDPFAEHTDDADPAPELTDLMLRLTKAALSVVSDNFRPPGEPKPLRIKYAFNPQEAFVYAEEGKPDLEHLAERMDPLEADVLKLARISFANPGISDADAAKLSKLPGGLYVTAPTDVMHLQAGDLIHLIDGHPALPEALYRARVDGPVQVRVRRVTGVSQELTFP